MIGEPISTNPDISGLIAYQHSFPPRYENVEAGYPTQQLQQLMKDLSDDPNTFLEVLHNPYDEYSESIFKKHGLSVSWVVNTQLVELAYRLSDRKKSIPRSEVVDHSLEEMRKISAAATRMYSFLSTRKDTLFSVNANMEFDFPDEDLYLGLIGTCFKTQDVDEVSVHWSAESQLLIRSAIVNYIRDRKVLSECLRECQDRTQVIKLLQDAVDDRSWQPKYSIAVRHSSFGLEFRLHDDDFSSISDAGGFVPFNTHHKYNNLVSVVPQSATAETVDHEHFHTVFSRFFQTQSESIFLYIDYNIDRVLDGYFEPHADDNEREFAEKLATLVLQRFHDEVVAYAVSHMVPFLIKKQSLGTQNYGYVVNTILLKAKEGGQFKPERAAKAKHTILHILKQYKAYQSKTEQWYIALEHLRDLMEKKDKILELYSLALILITPSDKPHYLEMVCRKIDQGPQGGFKKRTVVLDLLQEATGRQVEMVKMLKGMTNFDQANYDNWYAIAKTLMWLPAEALPELVRLWPQFPERLGKEVAQAALELVLAAISSCSTELELKAALLKLLITFSKETKDEHNDCREAVLAMIRQLLELFMQ